MSTTLRMRRFPQPDEILSPPDVDGQEVAIKLMTFPIYWRETGLYFCVVWNLEEGRPQVLLLNHTLFPELRDHIRRELDDVAGQTFVLTCVHEGRIVRHRLTATGVAPLLNEDKLAFTRDFCEGLYEAVEVSDV